MFCGLAAGVVIGIGLPPTMIHDVFFGQQFLTVEKHQQQMDDYHKYEEGWGVGE